MSLTVTCLADLTAFALLRDEWVKLDARTSPRAPFTSPDWKALWWQTMRRKSRGLLDQLRVFVLRRPDGSLAGVAPMMLTSIPAKGPLRLGELQFIGADANMTEVRGVVCAPEDHAAVIAALGHEVMRRAGEWDGVRWSGLRCDPTHLAAAVGSTLQATANLPCMVLQLKPRWEEFRAALPRNIKESLRKCYNAPKRDGIEMTFRIVEQELAVQPALERFFELHRLRALARVEADAGRLRIFEMRIGDTTVASRVGFTRGDCLYLYYSGYEPAFAQYAIMTRAVAATESATGRRRADSPGTGLAPWLCGDTTGKKDFPEPVALVRNNLSCHCCPPR
jgi:CelD/BcsL family acetyltransferase involved in cellulose biosynthesis